MRSDIHPFPATQAEALSGPAPTVSSPARRGVAGHSAAILPHRRAYVLTAWRQVRAWIGVAYPGPLDTALDTLQAKFPALAENIARLALVAEGEASVYENTANVDCSAFQAHLARWERAVLDALAALTYAQPASPGHQLELEVSHG